MKTCTKCKEERDESEFRRNNQTKDGLSYQCVYCARKEANERHQQNKHKVRVPTNKTHKTCRTCKREMELMAFYKNCGTADGYDSQCKSCKDVSTKKSISKIYERGDPSNIDWKGTKKCSTCRKEQPNTEFHINRRMKHGLSSQCKSCEKAFMQTVNGRIVQMTNRAKMRANKKGIEFTLTSEQVKDKLPPNMVCPILDIPLEWGGSSKEMFNSPSIDRIDNSKGYTYDNIQVISLRANRIKNDSTKEELLKIIESM